MTDSSLWNKGDLILLNDGYYELTVPINNGAAGEVWQTVRKGESEPLAIKLTKVTNDTELNHLLSEFNFLDRMNKDQKKYFVPIYDKGVSDGNPCIVMKLMVNSADKLAPFTHTEKREFIQFGHDISQALNIMHQLGFMHCDLKPSNILTDGHCFYLSDFGCSIKQSENTHLHTFGTFGWMAPEQALKQKTGDNTYQYLLSKSADIYAFGLNLFYMLTGSLPGASKNLGELAKATTPLTLDSSSYRAVLSAEEQRLLASICADLYGTSNANFKKKQSEQTFLSPLEGEFAQSEPALDEQLFNCINHCIQHNPTERPTDIEQLTRLFEKLANSCDYVIHAPTLSKTEKTKPSGATNISRITPMFTRKRILTASATALSLITVSSGVYFFNKASVTTPVPVITTAPEPKLDPKDNSLNSLPTYTLSLPINAPNPGAVIPEQKKKPNSTLVFSKYEVSNKEYTEFAKATDRAIPAGEDDEPVSLISAFDAIEYAKWLSAKTNTKLRLPTRDEWLKAAGKETNYIKKKNVVLSNGSPIANLADLSFKGTSSSKFLKYYDGFAKKSPVGSFAPVNGLFDMLGNVSEWTLECAEQQKVTSIFDFKASGCQSYAMGGNWLTGSNFTLEKGLLVRPNNKIVTIGFRLVEDKN